MNQLTAFMKKEFLEQLRTGKLVILAIIFCLFGIMNPAIARLTPWIMEMMSEDLADAGMVVGSVEADALTSWTQFFKNMPMALIIFIVMFSGILTAEYQKGTLVHVVTKGLKRWKILISKTAVMAVFWTSGCLVSFLITYGYNAYFWDSEVAGSAFFAAFCFYLFGLWLISVILPASAVLKSAPFVSLTTGVVFLAAYLPGMIPKISKYLPVYLMESSGLLTGRNHAADYFAAVVITLVLVLVNMIASVILFNKRTI